MAMRWSRLALLAGAVFVARQILLAGLTPALHAPDEQAHFDYAQHLAERRALPVCAANQLGVSAGAFSPEVTALLTLRVNPIVFHAELPLPSPAAPPLPEGPGARETSGCNYVSIYPPLYYAVAALGYRAASAGTLYQRIFAARLTGLFWGLATVLSAFAAGALLRGRSGDGLLVALAVGLHPMASFLFAAVNNDTAAIACASAAIACLSWLWRRPASVAPLAALAVCATAGALSKPTFLLVLPWIAAAALVIVGARRAVSWLRIAIALAPAIAFAVLWTWWMRDAYSARIAGAGHALSLASYLRAQLAHPQRLFFVWIQLYWMGWGWVDVLLRKPAYVLVSIVLAAAGVGGMFKLRSGSRPERFVLVAGAVTTAGLVATLHLLEWRVMQRGEVAFIQGRYALTLLVPHALMLLVGLRGLGERLRLHFDAAWIAVPLLVALDVAAASRCVARYTPAGVSRLAHAREVYESFAPGAFRIALALHALALLAAVGIAAVALVKARGAVPEASCRVTGDGIGP